MNVSVRDIYAKCSNCGSRDFMPLGHGPVRLPSRMACIECGWTTTYRALLESIGDEAMRRANKALDKLRKSAKTGRPRK
jgi:hypothetical protein